MTWLHKTHSLFAEIQNITVLLKRAPMNIKFRWSLHETFHNPAEPGLNFYLGKKESSSHFSAEVSSYYHWSIMLMIKEALGRKMINGILIYQAQMTDDWLDSKARKVTPLKLFLSSLSKWKNMKGPVRVKIIISMQLSVCSPTRRRDIKRQEARVWLPGHYLTTAFGWHHPTLHTIAGALVGTRCVAGITS